jgi:hypothetical protein
MNKSTPIFTIIIFILFCNLNCANKQPFVQVHRYSEIEGNWRHFKTTSKTTFKSALPRTYYLFVKNDTIKSIHYDSLLDCSFVKVSFYKGKEDPNRYFCKYFIKMDTLKLLYPGPNADTSLNQAMYFVRCFDTLNLTECDSLNLSEYK